MTAALIPAAVSSPAAAQVALLGPLDQPAQFVSNAPASPYGRALVAELGRALQVNADAAYLQAEGLTPEQLGDHSRAAAPIWGAR